MIGTVREHLVHVPVDERLPAHPNPPVGQLSTVPQGIRERDNLPLILQALSPALGCHDGCDDRGSARHLTSRPHDDQRRPRPSECPQLEEPL